MSLNEALDRAMAQPGDALAIWFEGACVSWQEVREFSRTLEALLVQLGVGPGQQIGILCRNNPPHAAALLSAVLSGRSATMVYTLQSAEGLAQDIEHLALPCILALEEDWSELAVAAARNAGSVGIRLHSRSGLGLSIQPALAQLAERHRNVVPRTMSISVLSSGTTGKPKQVDVGSHIFSRALATMSVGDQPGTKIKPMIAFSPISGISGIIQFLGSIARAGAIYLLDRFELERWLEALSICQPETIIMFAPMIHKVLEKNVAKDRLACLHAVFGGAGPLDPGVQDEFEQRYGIPIYWGYGCTEFAGTATSWNPALRAKFGGAKRGSAGRAMPGVTLRVVDPGTRNALAPGEVGLLEARIELLGPEWIRTTDLAMIDEDDFLFLRGRADQAINRGGFKIMPDTIVAAVTAHPKVREAVAFGIADRRLGEIPVVAVELIEGADVAPEELLTFVRPRLAAYAVPARVIITSMLPRTGSLKPDLAALKAMVAEACPP